jgi:hypothetical protein
MEANFTTDTNTTFTMEYSNKTSDELIQICKDKQIKGYSGKKKDDIIKLIQEKDSLSANTEHVTETTNTTIIVNKKKPKKNNQETIEDKYTSDILKLTYNSYKQTYVLLSDIITTTGLPIRHQNPPEDVTENIVKFIIHNYEEDISCKWAKAVGLNGDLYSDKYNHEYPIEVKAFSSDGPSSFGPKKKFGVIYFLDMRNWLNNIFKLWKVNLNSDSQEWKNIKMNKTQTNEEQCEAGRRPHISWDHIYPQIKDHCVQVYEGSFENIFIK